MFLLLLYQYWYPSKRQIRLLRTSSYSNVLYWPQCRHHAGWARSICPWQPFSLDSSSLVINKSLHPHAWKCTTVNQESWGRSSALSLRNGLHQCSMGTYKPPPQHGMGIVLHFLPPAGNSGVHLTIICKVSSRFLPFFPPTTSIICQDVPPEIHWHFFRGSQTKIPRGLPGLSLDLNVSTSDGRKVSLFLNGLTSPAGQKGSAQGSSGQTVGRTPRNR